MAAAGIGVWVHGGVEPWPGEGHSRAGADEHEAVGVVSDGGHSDAQHEPGAQQPHERVERQRRRLALARLQVALPSAAPTPSFRASAETRVFFGRLRRNAVIPRYEDGHDERNTAQQLDSLSGGFQRESRGMGCLR